MKPYKVLTINPGSTSTKVALFQGEECLYSQTVSHEAKELEQYASMSEQLPYRRDTVLTLLKEAGIRLEEVDVFVGRGGGLIAMEGGTYGVTDLMLEHARTCANGVIHPAALGSQLAHEFAQAYGAKAMVVNPPDVDELQDLARMTGIRGVHRIIHLHALNLKETAIRHSKNVMKKPYAECRYVVCHIGGGISISAHEKGRMIDGYDIVGGEGPMAPTRCGSISVANLLEYMKRLNPETGQFVQAITKFYFDFHWEWEHLIGCVINDPLAVAWFADRSLCSGFEAYTAVETGGISMGQTVVDSMGFYRKEANALILTRTDAKRFFRLFFSRILGIEEEKLDLLDSLVEEG